MDMDRKTLHTSTLVIALLGLAPACAIDDKNLGEDGETAASGDGETGDGDGDPGDGDGAPGDGDGAPEPNAPVCLDGPTPRCWTLYDTIELSATVLDVIIDDIDAAGENSIADVVMLTADPTQPLLVLHGDEDIFADAPAYSPGLEVVAGPLPTAVIPGLASGDFDKDGTEYIDVAYASSEGVVIGWDKGLGAEGGFDEVTLAAPCADPSSFAIGDFIPGGDRDIACVHAVGDGYALLLIENLGARQFADPLVIGEGLPEPTPLRASPSGQLLAHDRSAELIIAGEVGQEFLLETESVAATVWDLDELWTADGRSFVFASHEPQGLLIYADGPDGVELSATLATPALPYVVQAGGLDGDSISEIMATLASGQLGVWRGLDDGFAEPVLFEVGPDPREFALGPIYWNGDMDPGDAGTAIAVASGDSTVSIFVPAAE